MTFLSIVLMPSTVSNEMDLLSADSLGVIVLPPCVTWTSERSYPSRLVNVSSAFAISLPATSCFESLMSNPGPGTEPVGVAVGVSVGVTPPVVVGVAVGVSVGVTPPVVVGVAVGVLVGVLHHPLS